MKKFTPRPYQKLIINHVIDNSRCAIWADMGMGKTSSTLTALTNLELCGEDVFPALVLAPKRVARGTWPSEVKKWQHLNDLKVSPILGSTGKRVKALHTQADIYTMNYDNLVWLVDYCVKTLKRWPFKTIVADESTKLKGFRIKQGTKRSAALARVAHQYTERFIELTGTPSPNGLQDLWGQVWFLDAGHRLGRIWTAFKDRWFRQGDNGFGLEPVSYAQTEIQGLLADICLRVDAKDYFDLKDPIRHTIYVDLPDPMMVKYKELEREMYAEIEDDLKNVHSIEAANAAARTMKCLQFASGAAYLPRPKDDEGRPIGKQQWVGVHDEKIEALRDIVEEAAGKPILVAYYFKSDLVRLLKAFPQARVLDDKQETEDAWNVGKIPILLAHPASAGHGLNLQDGGNILVFFSHTWNLEHFMQMVERIGPVRQMQAGHDRPVFLYFIVAKDTVDTLVMQRNETKREVQDILLEAIKRRKQNAVK